jgi:hypothetical protein
LSLNTSWLKNFECSIEYLALCPLLIGSCGATFAGNINDWDGDSFKKNWALSSQLVLNFPFSAVPLVADKFDGIPVLSHG